jgi:fructuronate reductase
MPAIAAPSSALHGQPRLSEATLAELRPGALVPAYDRSRVQTGIVHLGLGAFARAHLAAYTDDVLAAEPGPWGIAGVSLQRPDQRDRLAPQDGLYTMLQRDSDGVQARIVFCLRQLVVASEQKTQLLQTMAASDCRIISLTITEKGYCHDPATGRLDPAHPDIKHDLQRPDTPRSAVGLITAALAARREAGLPPPTILCCDNLPHNGRLLAGLVRDFAALRTDALAAWIESSVAFPATMVDRIVPALTPDDLAVAQSLTGLADAAPVSHEPFRQWVIEDRFGPLGRPAWERAGAQLVADVAPYEHMKLRMLNGAHSALAYLGYLAGHETIADAVADPVLRTYVGALWNEIIPVLPPPPGIDLRRYAADLLARFENTAVRHRTWQIAMDGSQKVPQRLLATITDRLAQDLPIRSLALAVAGWIRYAQGTDERGQPIDVRDPLADRLRGAEAAAILRTEAVFGADLPLRDAFTRPVMDAYALLRDRGARAAASATRES